MSTTSAARDDLFLLPNATTAYVLPIIPARGFDEVVRTDLDYDCLRAARGVFCSARRSLLRRMCPCATSPDEVVASIFAAVTPRTRAIFPPCHRRPRAPAPRTSATRARRGDLTSSRVARGGQWPVDLVLSGVDLYAATSQVSARRRGPVSVCPPDSILATVADRPWGWVRNDHPSAEPFHLPHPMQGPVFRGWLTAPAAVRTRSR